MSTAQVSRQNTTKRRQSHIPPGTESNPRFAPSAAELGAACAQQILEEFRKGIEGVDLRASSAKKTGSQATLILPRPERDNAKGGTHRDWRRDDIRHDSNRCFKGEKAG